MPELRGGSIRLKWICQRAGKGFFPSHTLPFPSHPNQEGLEREKYRIQRSTSTAATGICSTSTERVSV